MVNNAFTKHIHTTKYLINTNVNKLCKVNIIFRINNLSMKQIYDKIILNVFKWVAFFGPKYEKKFGGVFSRWL